MDNFKLATQQKLRVQTNKGLLSVEQLWDLKLEDLDSLAVSLEEDYNNSKGKSFLQKRTVKDKNLKLQFDIVLDILQTKSEEMSEAQEKAEKKKHNQKILQLIAEKQDEELKGKSLKQLEAMLKEE